MHGVSDEAVETVYREEWGRIVATLIRLVGDFEVAEEAAQEAFTAAVDQWRVTGVPEFPRAWIIQTARNKAVDRLRRRARFEEKREELAATLQISAEPQYDDEEIPEFPGPLEIAHVPEVKQIETPVRGHKLLAATARVGGPTRRLWQG